jgi:hypothetical protein
MGAPKLPSSLENPLASVWTKHRARLLRVPLDGRQTALHLEEMSPGIGCESCHGSGSITPQPCGERRVDAESGLPKLSGCPVRQPPICAESVIGLGAVVMDGPQAWQRALSATGLQTASVTTPLIAASAAACHDPHPTSA